ncbi:MAG: S-methyl-5'-thioadenosine phosphorylase [Gammaproteobacteria bacterium]|nr:MAG: S-methyl-5'-thioadenosine phosphorylase [Gammaproteobacteria bacterium]RKZ96368.1 MAG: S-methyl-5'-thioadenosine phosphorylase [Gammaproteobacteria bacterium]
MGKLAIIGGTGLTSLDGLNIIEQRKVETPFGLPSGDLLVGDFHGNAVIFLPRHGEHHTIPPHRINYRANIWALHQQGVEQIIAVAAVGGIRDDMVPGILAVPDQIIDYTYGREQSFYSDDFTADKHIDFSYPYDQDLREKILLSAERQGLAVVDSGTYGATQGPRLETVAEIKRMAQDGCAMVGMTGMPEASLARELNIAYATCAVMANWAAGLTDGVITMTDIERTVTEGVEQVKQILDELIRLQ